MRQHRFFARVIVVVLTTFLLSSTALAVNPVPSAPSPGSVEAENELPVYLQLLAYVADLMSQGQEVPKALLNKITAYYRHGK